jgi:hypothetical protein
MRGIGSCAAEAPPLSNGAFCKRFVSIHWITLGLEKAYSTRAGD